ncbi:MAG: hypothetical protein R3E97_01575 [Candidatus Eisenbacteria bacterium]
MALWFTGSAIAPELAQQWSLTSSEKAWLTSAVQIGFVAGTAIAAILNLADILSAAPMWHLRRCRRAREPGPRLRAQLRDRHRVPVRDGDVPRRRLPPAMKMAATWFRSGRGFAIGTLVGSLALGKSTPYVVRAFGSCEQVVWVATAGAPSAPCSSSSPTTTDRSRSRAVRSRGRSSGSSFGTRRRSSPRAATSTHVGALRDVDVGAGVPSRLHRRLVGGDGNSIPNSTVSLLAFGAISIGGLGCVWAGWVSDRWGRTKIVNLAMALSGLCSLAVGLVFGMSPWIVWPLLLVWGFFVVADSAQFSAIDGGRPTARGRDGAHAPDVDRLPPHHGDGAGRAVAGRRDRLALVVRGPRPRPGRWDRVDSAAVGPDEALGATRG